VTGIDPRVALVTLAVLRPPICATPLSSGDTASVVSRSVGGCSVTGPLVVHLSVRSTPRVPAGLVVAVPAAGRPTWRRPPPDPLRVPRTSAKTTAVAVVVSVPQPSGKGQRDDLARCTDWPGAPVHRLARFRESFSGWVSARADALFEVTDALVCTARAGPDAGGAGDGARAPARARRARRRVWVTWIVGAVGVSRPRRSSAGSSRGGRGPTPSEPTRRAGRRGRADHTAPSDYGRCSPAGGGGGGGCSPAGGRGGCSPAGGCSSGCR